MLERKLLLSFGMFILSGLALSLEPVPPTTEAPPTPPVEPSVALEEIVDISGLEANSTQDNARYYLNTNPTGKGGYIITPTAAPLDISAGSTANFGMNKANSTLVVHGNAVQQVLPNPPPIVSAQFATKDFAVENGNLFITGGAGAVSGFTSYASATVTSDTFTQTGGASMVTGGTQGRALGLAVKNTYNHNGGDLFAYAGSGDIAMNSGIAVGNVINYPQFIMWPVDQSDYGTFTQNGGRIIAGGGDHDGSSSFSMASGISVAGTFKQTTGTIWATGGEGSFNGGIGSFSFIQETDGVIYTQGGAGDDNGIGTGTSVGIAADVEFVSKGTIYAIGGSGRYNDGILVGQGWGGGGLTNGVGYTQEAGKIYAVGGSGSFANGIDVMGVTKASVTSAFTQTGGSLYAYGGSGQNASGILVRTNDFAQGAGGYIEAYGGTYDLDPFDTGFNQNTSAGLNIQQGKYYQNGTLKAIGGAGTSGLGVYVNDSMILEGDVYIDRSGQTASIHVDAYDTQGTGGPQKTVLEFTAGSTLTPYVDFRKTQDLASGLITVTRREDYNFNVLIDLDARLTPQFANISAAVVGDSQKTPFLQFVNHALIDGSSTSMDIFKNADGSDASGATLTYNWNVVVDNIMPSLPTVTMRSARSQ